MAQYNTLNVRLSNSLLKELKSGIKNVSGVTTWSAQVADYFDIYC